MREHHVPGVSVAIIEHGALRWSQGFGVADARTGKAVTAETVFEAASMSKPIVALVAVQLVQEGRLDLDGPLVGYLGRDYLPDQPALANAFGVSYQRVDLDPIAAWTNVPASFSPAMQEQLKVTNTAFPASNNFDRFYDLYIYDSTDDATTNYDHVLVVPSTSGMDGAAACVWPSAIGRT
jgi:hypothetical protein